MPADFQREAPIHHLCSSLEFYTNFEKQGECSTIQTIAEYDYSCTGTCTVQLYRGLGAVHGCIGKLAEVLLVARLGISGLHRRSSKGLFKEVLYTHVYTRTQVISLCLNTEVSED